MLYQFLIESDANHEYNEAGGTAPGTGAKPSQL